MKTEVKTDIEITRSYGMLNEPSTHFSPQMREISNFFGGGAVNEDELELAKRIVTAGKSVGHAEFVKAVVDGASKRMVLIGGAGFGKSTEIKKLGKQLLEGACGANDQTNGKQPKIIHIMNLKDVKPEKKTTLQDVLFGSDFEHLEERKYLLEHIERNQSKAFILMDGLDQTRFDTRSDQPKGEYWEKASTETLMYNVLSGHILPNVKIVVASREHAVSTLPEEARPDYVVALAGFKEEHARNLFLQLVSKDCNWLWQEIEQDLGFLLSMLLIPIYLIFTAVVYQHCKKNKKPVPQYVTELLAKIVGLLPEDTKHMQKNIRQILHKLKKLSYHGMREKRMSFDKTYLKKYGLSAKEVADLISKVPPDSTLPNRILEEDFLYFFCHQSMQEFLAACFIAEMNLKKFKSFTVIEISVKKRSIIGL